MLTFRFVQMKQHSVNELATGFSLLLNKVKSSLHFEEKISIFSPFNLLFIAWLLLSSVFFTQTNFHTSHRDSY